MDRESKHWGMMNRVHEEYDATIESPSDAKAVANRRRDEASERSDAVVQPRPSRIEWQTETYNVTEKYGTDEWILLLPEKSGHERAALVVQASAATVRVVRFFVGDC